MSGQRPRMVIITAQNLASANTIRPVLDRLAGDIDAVLVLNNFPLASWKDLVAFWRLVARCGFGFLVFKFFEIWGHYLLSLLRGDSVVQMCKRSGVRCLEFATARDRDFDRTIQDTAPDYLVSTGPAILSRRTIDAPRIATLNCHAADLPAFRGPANYIWTLMAGETSRYVTIHRMQPKIDSGAIWRKRSYPIDPNWSVYEYNFNHTIDAGEFLAETLAEILATGPLQETEQSEAKATVRTFPTGSDMRQLSRLGIRLMRLRDLFECVGGRRTSDME